MVTASEASRQKIGKPANSYNSRMIETPFCLTSLEDNSLMMVSRKFEDFGLPFTTRKLGLPVG
jgi:hypothetical protein